MRRHLEVRRRHHAQGCLELGVVHKLLLGHEPTLEDALLELRLDRRRCSVLCCSDLRCCVVLCLRCTKLFVCRCAACCRCLAARRVDPAPLTLQRRLSLFKVPLRSRQELLQPRVLSEHRIQLARRCRASSACCCQLA